MELDYHEIGRRIARRRKALGLRQAEVGERAGISDKYLSCIERATSIPSLQVIVRLAIALDTTVDEFLFGAVHGGADDAGEMASLLRSMTPRQRALARSFLDWLREQKLE
ncbi:MAG: helix-turn-helix domain-containing protein [Gemmiger sp.]